MKKKIIAVLIVVLAAVAIVLGVNSGVGNASTVKPKNTPRVYCFNEPIRRHGHTVNRIECVSQGYNPN